MEVASFQQFSTVISLEDSWKLCIEDCVTDINLHIALFQQNTLIKESYQRQQILNFVVSKLRYLGTPAFYSEKGSELITYTIKLLESMIAEELFCANNSEQEQQLFTLLDALSLVRFYLICICSNTSELLRHDSSKRVLEYFLQIFPFFVAYEMQLLQVLKEEGFFCQADDVSLSHDIQSNQILAHQLQKPSLADAFVYFFSIFSNEIENRLVNPTECLLIVTCMNVLHGQATITDVSSKRKNHKHYQHKLYFETPKVFSYLFNILNTQIGTCVKNDPMRFGSSECALSSLKQIILLMSNDFEVVEANDLNAPEDVQFLISSLINVFLPQIWNSANDFMLDSLIKSKSGTQLLRALITLAPADNLDQFAKNYLFQNDNLKKIGNSIQGKKILIEILKSKTLTTENFQLLTNELPVELWQDMNLMSVIFYTCHKLKVCESKVVYKFIQTQRELFETFDEPSFWRFLFKKRSPQDAFQIDSSAMKTMTNLFLLPRFALNTLLDIIKDLINDELLLTSLACHKKGKDFFDVIFGLTSPIPIDLQQKIAVAFLPSYYKIASDPHGALVAKIIFNVSSSAIKNQMAKILMSYSNVLSDSVSQILDEISSNQYLSNSVLCDSVWS